MLIIFPLLSFSLFFAIFESYRRGWSNTSSDWRLSFLSASLLWGVLIVVGSEFASLLQAVGSGFISWYWVLVFAVTLSLTRIRREEIAESLSTVRATQIKFKSNALLFFGASGVVFTLLVIAWFSAPNTVDSLLYHLPRISHWIQNHSLMPYPTQYPAQLSFPNWSELAILNLSLLWGDFQIANILQWFSMVGSLIGISGITALLGGNQRSQWLAVVFGLSVPMGILQATSTQTDYVTALWLIALAYFVILGSRREPDAFQVVMLSFALGLGMLTKGTFYILATPLLLWYMIAQIRLVGFKPTALYIGCIAFGAFVLNLGFYTRNMIAFNNPLGPSALITNHFQISAPLRSLTGYPAALIKTFLLHFPTPWQSLNASIVNLFESVFGLVGAEFGKFSVIWFWNHEDIAGNPLHAVSIFVIAVVLLSSWRKPLHRQTRKFALAATLGLFLLPLILSYSTDQVSVRFHLPVFLLWAPIVGIVSAHWMSPRQSLLIGLFFLAASIPWVLFNKSRPLIGISEDPRGLEILCQYELVGCTRGGSILETRREEQLYANIPWVRDQVVKTADAVLRTGCKDIGLRIDSHDHEYPYWFELNAPENGLRIESIYPHPGLEKLTDSEFNPCVIICTICDDLEEVDGFDLVNSFGKVRIYTDH